MSVTELVSETVSLRASEKFRPVLPEGLAAELPSLESVFPVFLAPGRAPQPMAALSAGHEAALPELRAGLAARALEPSEQLNGATGSLPGPGWLAGFHPSVLPLLYGGFLAAGRADARSRFLRELRQCVANLQNLLAVDDAKRSPTSPDKVAASLGADAPRFLSVSRLMAVFGRSAGKPAVMDTERRHRCQSALTILEDAVRRQQGGPAFWLFHHNDDAPVELRVTDGRARQSDDPCTDALDFCNRQLLEIEPVLRALRTARLEAVSAYDPAIHDRALEHFGWQSADPHEIAAIPAPIAMEPAERLSTLSLNSFSRVLLSDRPVQILVSWPGPGAEEADIGAVALAHRGAFVLQSSLARWEHLSQAFEEMAQTLRPAVAVVSVPPAEYDASAAWREASLLARSRALPLYRYDPDREGEWPSGFELSEADATGFDALVLSARFRDQLRAIPPNAPDEGLMELSEYLRPYQAISNLTTPIVRVADEAGHMQRIAVTREMVRLCRCRSRAWEMLAALAAKPVRGQPEAGPPAQDYAVIREKAAKEAYMRVVALLADPESLVRKP